MADLTDALRHIYRDYTAPKALEELRKINNIPMDQSDINLGPDHPTPPPTHPSFRPYPEVIGGPELHNAVKETLRIAPQLQGHVKRIGYPPNNTVFGEMRDSKLPLYDYEHTNLLGVTSPEGIWINPNKNYQDELPRTVMHEMSHVAGNSEVGARESEVLWDKAHPAQDAPYDEGFPPAPPQPSAMDSIVTGLKNAGIRFKFDGKEYNPGGR